MSESLQLEQNRDDEEQKQQLEALNQSLFATIAEYTKIRNEHAKFIEQQLCSIRCDIERRIRSADLDNFDKQQLGTVCNDLLNGLRQKGRQLVDLCDAIKTSAENLNQLKLCFSEWGDGSGKATKGIKPICSSFDMQKRLELLEDHYEKSLNDFERAKNDLDNLDKHLEFSGNLLQSSSSSLQNDVLTPLEQHQLIRTNDNISKMCTKLETRIRQIRTQIELQESKKLNKKTDKEIPSLKNSEDVASFCVLKLEQLNIYENKNDGKVKVDNNNSANFRQNLFNYMTNLNQYKTPLEGNGIRLVQPVRPSLPAAKDNQFVETDEFKLKNVLLESLKPKPQLVSIGVQSPDFMALTPSKAKKTPTKPPIKPQKIKTPETPKSTFNQTKMTETLSKNVVGYVNDFTTPTKMTEKSVELPQLFSFKQQKQVITEVPNQVSTPITTSTIVSTSPDILPTFTTFITSTCTSTPTSTILTTTNDNSKQFELPTPQNIKENEKTPEKPKEQEKTEKENFLQKEAEKKEISVENNKIQQNVGDEGMEDEIVAPTSLTTTSQEHSISSVNFNFMGGLGATSTPVNANRNPFGSIQPKPSGLFGSTPQPQFGSGSVFGSSVINNQNSGNFGSFGAIGSGGSSGSSSFGSSPFAAAPVKPSIFGAAPFGSNVSSPFASNPVAGSGGSGGSGGGSMFGGGIKSGGGSTTGIGTTGFSAFASKSSAFGQLASQAQQQQTEQKPSLFGGGTALNTSGGGGTLFGGFGGSPTASTVPKPGFGQQKSSAFTTFRK
ncbi:hypothetical protein ACQ4LE_003691 [Meloidogyne hapla]